MPTITFSEEDLRRSAELPEIQGMFDGLRIAPLTDWETYLVFELFEKFFLERAYLPRKERDILKAVYRSKVN